MSTRNPFFWIPNFITSMNLVSGSIAVLLGIEGKPGKAAIFILAAAVFDFLDGMSAHLLKSYSGIGKQLDSLADLVSFGLAPAAILMSLLKQALSQPGHLTGAETSPTLWILLVLLVPVAGAFRLAKFNVDTRQSESFLGLPIPANALFFASLALVLEFGNAPAINRIILNPYFLGLAIILFSVLMLSGLPMFSMKFRHLKWQGNQVRFLFIALCLLLVIFLKLYALPLIIVSYILVSLFMAFAIHRAG